MDRFLFFVVLFVSLVSVKNVAANTDLRVDFSYVDGSCSEHFAMLRFEFLNNTNGWMELKDFSLDFGGDKLNDSAQILTGNRLLAWSEANALQKNRSSIKTGLLIGALSAISGVSRHSDAELSKVTGLLAAGTMTVKSTEAIQEKYRGDIFPAGHILAGEALLPAKLPVVKWVVVNTQNGSIDEYIKNITLRYKVSGSQRENVFDLRKSRAGQTYSCDWQASITPREPVEFSDFDR